jgi:hypothetical protein
MYLTGNIGDGKTTTAIGLMVSNFDEDDCLLITNPDQWQYVEPRTVSALLLDDIFGSGALDEKLLSEWESMFDQVLFNFLCFFFLIYSVLFLFCLVGLLCFEFHRSLSWTASKISFFIGLYMIFFPLVRCHIS